MANPREYTCRLLEMVDSGILSADEVLGAAIAYMSDSAVEDLMRLYQWEDMLVDESTEEKDSGAGISADAMAG